MHPTARPRIAILALVLVGAVWLSLASTRPPAALPADAPATEFSAARAMAHVAAVSREPHPTGSPEIHAVRDYILAELARLGIEAQTHVAVVQAPFQPRKVARAENIVARIPGADPGRAVLLVGHYDTVPNSPGAADDGAAVATLLETARALSAGPPLGNDVVLLFSDAEEPTVAGAVAALEHPWLAQVGLVLNFEMRGSSGPVYMFETGRGNGRIVPEFARAVPRPATSSLMRDVYATMPNDSDFTLFRDAGYAGFNFSALEAYTHYHTALDTADALDPRTLQHHGSYALGLARRFGALDLTEDPTGTVADDAVYFDLLGATLVHYPGFVAVPLAIVTLLAFLGLVVIGRRRGRLSGAGIGRGFVAALVALVAGPGAVTVLWWLIRATVDPPVIYGDTYNSPLFFLAFALLIVAITVALVILARRWVRAADLAVGALLWWAILLIAVTIVFPLANFFFTWPLLFALAGVGYLLVVDERAPLSWAGVIVLSVAALPGLLLVPPSTHAVAQGLLTLVGVTGAALVLVPLLLGLLVPHLAALTRSAYGLGRWWPVLGTAVLGTALLVAAVATVRVDPDHPRMIHLVYAFDADSGEAIWASVESPLLSREWTERFYSARAVRGPLPRFFGTEWADFIHDEAPAAPLPPPAVEILESTRAGDLHRVRLAVASARGASQVGFYLEPPAEVVAATVDGEPVRVADTPPDRDDPWALQYWGPLATGVELDLRIRSPGAVELRVVERVPGLPRFADGAIPPQPDHLIPFGGTGIPSHVTLVAGSVTIDGSGSGRTDGNRNADGVWGWARGRATRLEHVERYE